ncbi:TnsA endonuclease N-terminal domain-containing protein [Devosia faecipullorum]|uniref:TnsA endonuclease N-terminal domain-containing protein n=1 Tax=Devosia faecipullorum TaxID=2755039 RepID=UPI00187B1F0F|nr:TnsA endonuclease N-terminal domain-containing protein [Devosia faecipullorum]MBE7731672.1 TnsA endonuclease N-terminal domain-containing protein [Devosia faecipullorum]
MVSQNNSWENEQVETLAENWEQLAPGIQRFRLPGNEPVRRIITGRRAGKVGAFWSWKNRAHVAHESSGEEHCARVLEVHPDVTAYFGQPEQIRFQVEGERRPVRYTPDFLIRFGSRELRVEYKFYDDIRPPRPDSDHDEAGWYRFAKAEKTRRRLALVAMAYRDCGIDWQLFTERDLDALASRATVDEIVANAGRPLEPADLARLVSFLAAAPGHTASMADCCMQLEASEFPRGDVLARMPERLVSIDLHETIGDDTPVTLLEAAR